MSLLVCRRCGSPVAVGCRFRSKCDVARSEAAASPGETVVSNGDASSPFSPRARRVGRRMTVRARLVGATLLAVAVAGCGTTAPSRKGSSSSDAGASASKPSSGHVSAAMKALRSYNPNWSCQQMSLTSPEAERADAAANATGTQFGGGHVDFRPAEGREDGVPYAEFKCSTSHGEQYVWYQDQGGVWASLNAGLPASAVASSGRPRGASGSDLYASCAKTVASFRDMTLDLRTYLANHSNVASMHDDFAALGDDLGLMMQQADGDNHISAGSTFQTAAGVYSADAEEVEVSGQLQGPPADFASVLEQACSSSWAAERLPRSSSAAGTASKTTTTAASTASAATSQAATPTTGSFAPTPAEVAKAKAAYPMCAQAHPGITLQFLERLAASPGGIQC